MTSQEGKTYEALELTPRVIELRNNHRDYYVDLAKQADEAMRGPEQAAWWRLLDSEFDNVIQALEWSLARSDEQAALQLVSAVGWVSYRRNDNEIVRPWLRKALALDGLPSAPRASALLELSRSLLYEDNREAFALAKKASEVARHAGDRRVEARALQTLAKQFAQETGGPDAARRLHLESIELAESIGDERILADALSQIGFGFLVIGPDDVARAIEIYRRTGDRINLGWAAYGAGWAGSRELAEESLAIGRELDNDALISCAIELLGWLHRYQGDYDAARTVSEQGLEEYRRPGRTWPRLWSTILMLIDLAEIGILQGDYAKAREWAEEAVVLAHDFDSKMSMSTATAVLATVMAAEGDVERARSLSEDAVHLGREVARTEVISFLLALQGHVALVAGDFARARRAYEECLTLREYGDFFGSVPTYEVLFALADIALAEGKLEEARSRLAEAKGCSTFFKWRARGPVIEIGLARVARAAGDLNGSDALSASGMTAIYDLGHKPLIATCLEERAALAAARGDVECAAKIYGAAEALREAVHAPVPMLERRRYSSDVESVAYALDAWAEGREMSVEDAVELASFDAR